MGLLDALESVLTTKDAGKHVQHGCPDPVHGYQDGYPYVNIEVDCDEDIFEDVKAIIKRIGTFPTRPGMDFTIACCYASSCVNVSSDACARFKIGLYASKKVASQH